MAVQGHLSVTNYVQHVALHTCATDCIQSTTRVKQVAVEEELQNVIQKLMPTIKQESKFKPYKIKLS